MFLHSQRTDRRVPWWLNEALAVLEAPATPVTRRSH
jgi:hypothetical protein